jgi:hypothetical protein
LPGADKKRRVIQQTPWGEVFLELLDTLPEEPAFL